MHDRSLLGPADVSNPQLAAMVEDLLGLGAGSVELLASTATEVAYDLPALTTAGRYWVAGTARTPAGDQGFRLFVKHVQSWARSPLFAGVPPEFRETAAASVPWRTEPLAYRSDLGDRLPEGLSMPRALGVFDLDELSAAVWLEEVNHPDVPWDLARYERAAYLLGRLAASPEVRERADVGAFQWSIHDYVYSRLGMQVLPGLGDDAVWQHPVVAGTFDTQLRDRICAAGDRVQAYAEELAAFPLVSTHGDASPNNLLPGPGPGTFVLIDYGFWLPNPLGYDLGQLVVGDVQLGRRSPDLLPRTDAACLPAYVAGLRDEGLDEPEESVRRAHALQLLLFTGLSTLPFELLDATPTPDLIAVAADRAAIARFSLDLVDATGG